MLKHSFWAKIDKSGDCWEWTGYRDRLGYGRLRVDGSLMLAHRVAWELEHGYISEGLNVCHHCDNPPCVRPNHLFLGTQRDNIKDSVHKGRHACATKTHCPQGHAYDEENTRVFEGRRYCIPCSRQRSAEHWLKIREQVSAQS